MTTDNKTLADVQPGGRVRLGDGPTIEKRARELLAAQFNPEGRALFERGEAVVVTTAGALNAITAALSVQPSPGGQGGALEALAMEMDEFRTAWGAIGMSEFGYFVDTLKAALAARQPVGQEPLWCLHVLGMDDVHPAPSKAHAEKAAAWHNEQFKDQAARLGISIEAKVVPWPHSAESHAAGVAEFIPQWLIPQWQLDALEANAAPPAQAVDLPYSLDADPAGIRARVCDVITGTLMVGAQGHTPPPAGHWAEPFWQAARADATAQAADLGLIRDLIDYAESGKVAEPSMVERMRALIDSQAVPNG